jgi:predicted  nucleic acid-binding Zn-ribbon protein
VANQIEKTFYEKNQKILREEMFNQLRTRVVIIENEKREIGEVLTKVPKRNLHFEDQLTQDKSNHIEINKDKCPKIISLSWTYNVFFSFCRSLVICWKDL